MSDESSCCVMLASGKELRVVQLGSHLNREKVLQCDALLCKLEPKPPKGATNDTWSWTGASVNGKIPVAREGASLGVVGSKVVRTGGVGSGQQLELQVLNTEAHNVMEWLELTIKGSAPPGRSET